MSYVGLDYVLAMHDRKFDRYSGLMTFDNLELAEAAIRRQIRDMHFNSKITYDELTETEVVVLGTFDPKTGYFDSFTGDERTVFSCSAFVDGE